MAFRDFPQQSQGTQLLQRSLARGRLGHAYLFTGHQLEELEALARTLAKTLNCQRPLRTGRAAIDCCDQCLSCRKIDHGNHADVHWVRPESKLRVITVEQMRDLMQEIFLKPTEAEYKVCIVIAADRLTPQAANAFLKTLEEPPPKSVLILLTTEPQRVLETILSRCLRLNFTGEGPRMLTPAQLQWLTTFSEMAAAGHKSLLGRYRLMDVLLQELNKLRDGIEETLRARSPLERYEDAEEELRERWEEEYKAAVEAEYRRQRADLLAALQGWLRDVWLQTLETGDQVSEAAGEKQKPVLSATHAEPGPATGGLVQFPHLVATQRVARKLSAREARDNLGIMEQLQRWLHTNVQEALALEVGLLKLRL